MNAWVATTTWANEGRYRNLPGLVEAGGIYTNKSAIHPPGTDGCRRLVPGEPEASCRVCGRRFASTEEGTPDMHLRMHIYGDDDCPSICQAGVTR